jgi:hypothetical protein
MRHGIGILCVATLVASVSLTARAVQPAMHDAQPASPSAATNIRSAPTVHASGKVCPLSRRRALAHRASQRSS